MIIDNKTLFANEDVFYIDTEKEIVKAKYHFDIDNISKTFEDRYCRKVTPKQWTDNVANNDNDQGIRGLIDFLDSNEYVIDWSIPRERPEYNVIIFSIKSFKGLPKKFVEEWLDSGLSLESYKKKFRGKVKGEAYGF